MRYKIVTFMGPFSPMTPPLRSGSRWRGPWSALRGRCGLPSHLEWQAENATHMTQPSRRSRAISATTQGLASGLQLI